MPRPKPSVKSKGSIGLIDLHFHGAYGIDLMSAGPPQLNELSLRLAKDGIAGFCATTLSVAPQELLHTVTRLGQWIASNAAPGAKPLGIHLEGPFISPGACGAHPREAVRPVGFSELERLWDASERQLKIITIAPEMLTQAALKRLVAWANRRRVILSLGHSRATQKEAKAAFDRGFRGVTHAWNALPFHHRKPGPLGAAIGRKDTYLELIIDQVHVDPSVIRWTRALHERCCFVSDCVSAAATPVGQIYPFGHLRVQFDGRACRLVQKGQKPARSSVLPLAGGGLLLTESYSRWIEQEARATRKQPSQVYQESVRHVTTDALEALGLKPHEIQALDLPTYRWRWDARLERLKHY